MSNESEIDEKSQFFRITRPAIELSGGDISNFRGREGISPDAPDNSSTTRTCVELGKNEISGEFSLANLANSEEKAIFRINGMWDIYKNISHEMIHASKIMDTTGVFRVELNESTFWAI